MAKKKPASRVKIAQGDCVLLMQLLPAESVHLAFVDPPYNIDYEYAGYDDNAAPDVYLAWCETWMQSVQRVLRKDGAFWLAIGDEYVSELDVLAKRLGFFKRSHVVWHYTFSVQCAKNFARSHTHLLYYTRHKSKFTFNADDAGVRVPSSRQLLYKDARANPKGKLPDNTWFLLPTDIKKALAAGDDTWLESRVCGTFKERHDRGTYGKRKGCPQMPQAVMERVLRACSNRDDVVLDPMSGTFATGEAAIRLGRKFIGFELCEEYVAAGKARLAKISKEAA